VVVAEVAALLLLLLLGRDVRSLNY